jgi:PAS domain-containing protein
MDDFKNRSIRELFPGNELLQKRQCLSKLFENLPCMVYRCSNVHDWTLDFVSEGSYELTGYTVDELMDDEWRRFSNFILPDASKCI